MPDLDKLFSAPGLSGVHRVGAGLSVAEIAVSAATHHLRYFRVPIADLETKEEFLRATGAALSFPAHFGENWDAFEECLTDLDWCPAKGYVLLVEGANAFARKHPHEWTIAETIFRDVADFWRDQGTAFFVLFS